MYKYIIYSSRHNSAHINLRVVWRKWGCRQVMKCDVHHSRNSTVSVLFLSGIPWVSPALLTAILVSAHIRWLGETNKASITDMQYNSLM